MKKIKAYVLGLLLAVTMISASACGKSNSANESQSSGTNGSTASQTTAASESSTSTSGESAKGSNEESTGVIDGVINDVEKGVNDITGNGTTAAGTENTQASDR